MEFVSFKLSKKYNLGIITPFLDDTIIKFSQSLSVNDKIAIHNRHNLWKIFFETVVLEKYWETRLLGEEKKH